MILADVIGYAAVVVGTPLMLPQVIKSWKTKSMRDVSFVMLILYFLNCLLWASYGLLLHIWPVIIANGIGFVIAAINVTLKIKFGFMRNKV